jgi:hypothetical protein
MLGKNAMECDGKDKFEWATAISPHLDLEQAKFPSLKAFIEGLCIVNLLLTNINKLSPSLKCLVYVYWARILN